MMGLILLVFFQECPIPMVGLQWDEEVYEAEQRLDFA